MKKLITVFTLLCLFICCGDTLLAGDFILTSPDGKIKGTIAVGRNITYALTYENKPYLFPSAIGMRLSDGRILGENMKLIRSGTSATNKIIKPLYGICAELREQYKELVLEFSGNYKLVCRAYNEGFAYRFVTGFKDSVVVLSEQNEFRFAGDYSAYFHQTLSESDYKVSRLSEVPDTNYSSLPLLVKAIDGLNILIHESAVMDYPCMSIAASENNRIFGKQAAYPRKVAPGGNMNVNLRVVETEDYIARTSGSRSFPWRLVSFVREDRDILSNQLVYLLSAENKLKDVSWIRPGKVAWDWWNALNLSGVNFKTGCNNDTYKYFIDFASANGIEYVNLDAGWSELFDLLKVNDNLNMPELVAYARKKNVGIILWCVWYTLDRQMQQALDQFERWGISGLKVDFMERDDQVVVNFQERLLRETARRKMLVNYHGVYHPNGMERAYPNQINTEGVKGLEWNKFDPGGTSPQTDVTIPFIRMFAGAMDYTPGAMQNYNRADWKQISERPVSQGTRCHQLAMYAVYYAPLQMLADAPTAYEKEPEYLKYLAAHPTTWDETYPLDSRVGEYVCVARRKGNNWFVGAMTNWTPRTISVKTDFLQAGASYMVEMFMDGLNAEKTGNDYHRVLKQVKRGDVLQIVMASGGGWSARFQKTGGL